MVAPSSSSLPPPLRLDNDPPPPRPPSASSSSSNDGPSSYLLPMASPMSPFVSAYTPSIHCSSSCFADLCPRSCRVLSVQHSLPRKVTFHLVQSNSLHRQQLPFFVQPRSRAGYLIETLSASRSWDSSGKFQGDQNGGLRRGRRRGRSRSSRGGEFRTGQSFSTSLRSLEDANLHRELGRSSSVGRYPSLGHAKIGGKEAEQCRTQLRRVRAVARSLDLPPLLSFHTASSAQPLPPPSEQLIYALNRSSPHLTLRDVSFFLY